GDVGLREVLAVDVEQGPVVVELCHSHLLRACRAGPLDEEMVVRVHRDGGTAKSRAEGRGQGARGIVAVDQVEAGVELLDAIVCGIRGVRGRVEYEEVA